MLSYRDKQFIIFDTNVFIHLYQMKGMNLEKCLKVSRYLYPKDEIQKIYILESMYNEIELIKKGKDDRSKAAKKIYSDISKELIKNSEIFEYIEVEKNVNGVDDSLIDFSIENNGIFFSLDLKTYIRYLNKIEGIKTPKSYTKQFVFLNKFKKMCGFIDRLDYLTDNISSNIQKILKDNDIDMIDYISLSQDERFDLLIDNLINQNIIFEQIDDYSEEEFKKQLKEQIKNIEEFSLSNENLKLYLEKNQCYKFGAKKKQTLREKYREIINRFLWKQGITFDELLKKELFHTEEEIIMKIVERESNEK